jgi:site-specific DNA-methyltransferase (adenine-specific)
MRQIVRASLPLGKGVVLDPFMGGGSTVAAAVAVGYESVGLELDPAFFQMAVAGIPKLAAFSSNGRRNGSVSFDTAEQQQLVLLDES